MSESRIATTLHARSTATTGSPEDAQPEHGAGPPDRWAVQHPWRLRSAHGLAVAAVVLLGALLRTYIVAAGRPLWLDEASVALNIAGRSFLELMRPLDYDQAAPIPFLWTERLMLLLGGTNEFALRLFPLACGIALLIAIHAVGARLLGRREALLAVAAAAFSTLLIYYSAEVKQYGVDALVTAVLLSLTLSVFRRPACTRAWRRLIAGGCIALAFSQPAVFVLAGAGIALLADADVRRTRHWRLYGAAAASAWLLTFGLLYAAFYRPTATAPFMLRFWEGTFLTPGAPDFLHRVLRAGRNLLIDPIFVFMRPDWTRWAWVFALLFAGGLVRLWRRHGPAMVLLFAVPYTLVVVAAVAGVYPVAERLLLFLAPILILTYAAAIGGLVDLLPARLRAAGFVSIVVLFLAWRVPVAMSYAADLPRRDPVKRVIHDVAARIGDDPVYVFGRGAQPWMFYTTDWRRPDAERLRWMAAIQSSSSANFSGVPPRGRRVAHEGDDLYYRYRGRMELAGIGAGGDVVARVDRGHRLVGPDEGWGDNEARRMRAAARPCLWVFIAYPHEAELEELLAAIRRAGGVEDRATVESSASGHRICFAAVEPARASHGAAGSAAGVTAAADAPG